MEIMKLLLSVLFFISLACSAGDVWEPKVDFDLESSSYKETLIWVSGISYALSAYQKQNNSIFCGAPSSIGSQQLLRYLNEAHSKQRITAEQATETIFSKLKGAYPCA